MEAFKALADHLALPPWLFALALVLFLAGRGSRQPWTRSGGVIVLALTAATLGTAMSDEGFRRLILHPERLPVLVLLLSSGGVLWLEMYRFRRDVSDTGGPTPANGAFTTTDAVGATAVGLALVACALLYPTTLGPLADPFSKPALVKAPWFLVGLQELQHYFDPWVPYGALPLVLLAGLLGLPYLESEKPGASRRSAGYHGRSIFLFGWLFLWLWPMAVGALLRGPGWNAFGPFEPWDPARPAMAPPRAFSEIFWIQWLHMLEPVRWWIRELPGALLLGGYFVLLPMGLLRWRATRDAVAGTLESMGPLRFHAATAWVLALAIVPLKMIGRWLLDIGYWISLPELSFNF